MWRNYDWHCRGNCWNRSRRLRSFFTRCTSVRITWRYVKRVTVATAQSHCAIHGYLTGRNSRREKNEGTPYLQTFRFTEWHVLISVTSTRFTALNKQTSKLRTFSAAKDRLYACLTRRQCVEIIGKRIAGMWTRVFRDDVSPRYIIKLLVFKLSPCSKCNVFLFGQFPGVWVLIADVSELTVGSMKMEPTVSSETSAIRTQTPGKMEPTVSSETSAIRTQTPGKMEPTVSAETSAIRIQTPGKMEPTVSSETSAIRTQTPGNYPETNTLQYQTYFQDMRKDLVLSVGEFLKSWYGTQLSTFVHLSSSQLKSPTSQFF